MIVLEPFRAAHLDMFVPGKWDGEINTWEFREWALRQTGNGQTAIIDGKVVGCLFITQPVHGVSEVQIFGSDDARKKHWLWLGLSFKRALERYNVPQNLGIECIRVRVYQEFAKSRQWVERMGFMPKAIEEDAGMIVYEKWV